MGRKRQCMTWEQVTLCSKTIRENFPKFKDVAVVKVGAGYLLRFRPKGQRSFRVCGSFESFSRRYRVTAEW